MRTQANINVKTTLKRAPVNAKHIHVQVCRFKFLKDLLPKLCYNIKHWKGLLKSFGQKMGRCKVGPSPKKQHASTSIESSMLDMPNEEEELDVNELKGSKQINMETRVLTSNDQNTTTTTGSIDKTSFDDGQKQDNNSFGTKSQDMLQDMLEARISGVSNPPHPNMGGENQSIPIPSHIIHPSPLHPYVIL